MSFWSKFNEFLFGQSPAKLRERYYAAQRFFDGLEIATKVYSDDPGIEAISSPDYLEFLNAFEAVIKRVKDIPTDYDIDFRRDLPGGGLDGLTSMPDMVGRIDQARRYVTTHGASSMAGQGILQNISAVLRLVDGSDADSSQAVDKILESLQPTIDRVAGNIIR